MTEVKELEPRKFRFISRHEAAAILGCSYQTICNWIESGILKGHCVSRWYLLQRFADSHSVSHQCLKQRDFSLNFAPNLASGQKQGTKIAKITWNNKEQLGVVNKEKALKMRALVIVYPNYSKLLIINHLPMQK